MISRYEVTLGGKKLSAVDENLLILDVAYSAPNYSNEAYKVANRDGARVYNRYRDKASVTVTFELHIYDTVKRQTALQNVITWAKNGGVLKINDRANQQLNVICDGYPAINSVRNWTDPLSITFSAYAKPWWEDTKETVVTLTGKNARGTLKVPGNAGKAYVGVQVTTAAAITSLTVKVGDTSITLNGLSVASGKTITFSYSAGMILSIKTGSTSLLNKRTAGSSDDLIATAGADNAVSVTASGNVTAKFTVRGVWM